MRAIITGSKHHCNPPPIELVIRQLVNEFNITEIANGGEKGVEEIVINFARKNKISVSIYDANKDKKMIKDFRPELVVSFVMGNGKRHVKILKYSEYIGIKTLRFF